MPKKSAGDKWEDFVLGPVRKTPPVKMPVDQQITVVLTEAAQREQARRAAKDKRNRKPGIGG